MSLRKRIDADIREATLGRRKEELEALRSIKSLILLAESEKGSGGDLTEEAELKILMKAAKQRKESAEIFQRENRPELAQRELVQLEVISRYLPKALSEEEILEVLRKVIAETGATGPQDLGKVMGPANKALAGKADGSKIAQLVRQLLTA